MFLNELHKIIIFKKRTSFRFFLPHDFLLCYFNSIQFKNFI